MLRFLTRRRVLVLVAGAAFVLAGVLGRAWKASGDPGGQQPVEPFRIAGNLYYVGANDATSFLITGPEGHVLLDGGYPGTAANSEAVACISGKRSAQFLPRGLTRV
jgi:metallo-beta-lactamase class B